MWTGRRDGQTMMVRTGSAIEAHQWSEAEQRWIKIGNVTGGTSERETMGSGTKSHYEGKVCFLRGVRGIYKVY